MVAVSATSYLKDDVVRSWNWLGHCGYTELLARHPAYRPGREHFDHNRAHDAFPKVQYATCIEEVLGFVQEHHRTHLVCYGLNERPKVFRKERGYLRAALEGEIEKVKSLLMDIDPVSGKMTQAHRDAIEALLIKSDDWFQDLGLKPPATNSSGRGYHKLFAIPEVLALEWPDIAARCRRFVEEYAGDYHKEFANLECVVDSTQSLRQMVKIYGTAKPGVGVLSEFYGGAREEDSELRKYLLSMVIDPAARNSFSIPMFGPQLVVVGNELPLNVQTLLCRDEKLRALWAGRGKPDGSDVSGSGYDFSVARRLLSLGVSDVNDLATALALRPEGSYRKSNKDVGYICRTIGKAMGS